MGATNPKILQNMTQKTQQYTQNIASTKRTVSQSTEALITAKCQISDLSSLIINAMELVYGETQSDMIYNKVCEAAIPLRDLVDLYIIESIDCNLGSLSSTEF